MATNRARLRILGTSWASAPHTKGTTRWLQARPPPVAPSHPTSASGRGASAERRQIDMDHLAQLVVDVEGAAVAARADEVADARDRRLAADRRQLGVDRQHGRAGYRGRGHDA